LVCNFKRDFCRLDLCQEIFIDGLSSFDFFSVPVLFCVRLGCVGNVGKVDNE